MIRIGTRALISINGKPLPATHWDGYPSCLGLDLLKCDKSLPAVVKVARGHTIDAAHSSIREHLNADRVRTLAEKHNLPEAEIRQGKRRGFVICAGDYEIGDIKNYGDWADYEYDIRGEQVYFRPLDGGYPMSLRYAPGFQLLSEEDSAEG